MREITELKFRLRHRLMERLDRLTETEIKLLELLFEDNDIKKFEQLHCIENKK